MADTIENLPHYYDGLWDATAHRVALRMAENAKAGRGVQLTAYELDMFLIHQGSRILENLGEFDSNFDTHITSKDVTHIIKKLSLQEGW